MIIPARECHACQMLTRGLRAADVQEIEATIGAGPEVGLLHSMRASERTWAMLDDKSGVAPWPGQPDVGSPWLLATDDWRAHRREVVANTRAYIAEMARGYTALSNFVLATHRDSIRWLTYGGFRFVDYVPEHGVGKQPFLQFFRSTPCAHP